MNSWTIGQHLNCIKLCQRKSEYVNISDMLILDVDLKYGYYLIIGLTTRTLYILVHIYNEAILWFTYFIWASCYFVPRLYWEVRVQFCPLTFNCVNLVPILWKWLHVTLAPTSLLEIDSFLWNSFQIEWVYFDPYYYEEQRFWKGQNLCYFLWLISSGNKVSIELSLELKQLNWHNH